MEHQTVEIKWADFAQLNEIMRPNPSNRVTGESSHHINRIAKSICEEGFDETQPICIDKTGMILSGHNRYYAASQEKSGVYYMVSSGGAEDFVKKTKISVIVKKWSTEDWVEYYSKGNNADYVQVKAFLNRYDKLGSKLILAILLGKANHVQHSIYETLMQGTFKVTESIARAMTTAEQLMQVYGAIDDKWKTGKVNLAVGLAILHIMKHPDYDHAVMIAKLQRNKFIPQSRREWNIEKLQDIYNKGMRKNQIDFLASYKKSGKDSAAEVQPAVPQMA